MALNTCKMWFNGIKIAFFSKNLQKNRPTAGVFAPRPPKASGGWEPPPPDPPSVIPLSYISFLNTFPKLNICVFELSV